MKLDLLLTSLDQLSARAAIQTDLDGDVLPSVTAELTELLNDITEWLRASDNDFLAERIETLKALPSGPLGTPFVPVDLLTSHIRRIQRTLSLYDIKDGAGPADRRGLVEGKAGRLNAAPASGRIFVVHGHNDLLLMQVVETLRQLSCQPIVLKDQPNEGRTIIEKFEHNADVGFAVILMSVDDFGGSRHDTLGKQPRARQNVIMELGYFTGVLGRRRTIILKEDEVEAPSDILGIAYTPVDPGGAWRYRLAKELKAAGFDIDLNAI
ncbi:TIR domain-containing protein [Salipiger sp.]|uniref:TIR domain-containing protein n=1 Tax=Salipiger sp. TaxID=2078585 RepID=UPI003A96A878